VNLIDARGGPLDVDPHLLLRPPYVGVCLAVMPKPPQTPSIGADGHSTRGTPWRDR
jgi:hypothetical protein